MYILSLTFTVNTYSHGQKLRKSEKLSERGSLTDKNNKDLKNSPREAPSRTKITKI